MLAPRDERQSVSVTQELGALGTNRQRARTGSTSGALTMLATSAWPLVRLVPTPRPPGASVGRLEAPPRPRLDGRGLDDHFPSFRIAWYSTSFDAIRVRRHLQGGLTARHTCGEGSTMVPVHIRVSAEGPIANRDDLTTLRTRHDPPATARFTAIRVGTLPRFRVTRDARAMHASLRGRRTTSGGGSCARGTCICTPHVESASPAAGRCHVLRRAACS